jgi:branched-chain amino acid transport system permease protein
MAYGGVIALLAAGFSLIIGVAKIVNMAHTAFYMVGAFIILSIVNLGIPLWLSCIIGMIVTCLLAMVIYTLFFDRIKQHQTAVMIVSIALALLTQEILLLIFSAHHYGFPSFVEGFIDIEGVRLSYKHVFAFIISGVCLLILWAIFKFTRTGKAILCVAQDQEVANLMGINVSRISMVAMVLSVALAVVAAILTAPIYMVSALMWVSPLVLILASVVLGGMGSVKGSVIAAFILSFAETAVVFLVPGGGFLKGAVSLVVMVIVLIFRPEGLFGVVFEEERL